MQQNDSLNRMRIASPCSVGWERMAGNEQVRFCDQCNLHVYNISAMTSEQAASLIASKEGRICARLYRRADGTVLTRDCPVGLRAFRKRASKLAGAVLTALLSLCSGAFGQTKPQEDKACSRIVALKIKKTVLKDEQGIFAGKVLDEVGAVVPGAHVTLTNERTKKQLSVISSSDGEFGFAALAAGKYSLEIEAPEFKLYTQQHLVVNPHESLQASATLQFNGETVTVGILMIDTPLIETSNGERVISGELLRRLPINE